MDLGLSNIIVVLIVLVGLPVSAFFAIKHLIKYYFKQKNQQEKKVTD